MQKKENQQTKHKLSKEEQMYIASMITKKYIEVHEIEEKFWSKRYMYTEEEIENERDKYFKLSQEIFDKMDEL